jgi:hypothetical protein
MGIFIQGILIQRVLSTQDVLPKLTGKCFFIYFICAIRAAVGFVG